MKAILNATALPEHHHSAEFAVEKSINEVITSPAEKCNEVAGKTSSTGGKFKGISKIVSLF